VFTLEVPVSAFLFRLGRSSARHPFRVIGVWLMAAVAIVALQSAAGGEFDDTFRVPGVESQRAADVLQGVPRPGRTGRPHRAPHDAGRLDDANTPRRRAARRHSRRRRTIAT
jgi:RND superfamily putative drug exporter